MEIRKQVWLQILGVMMVLAPVLAGAVYAFVRYQDAEGFLDQTEPRYARLLGLESQSQQLDQAVAHTSALVSQYAYPDSLDATQAGNDAQRRIRDLFAKAGVDVISSQVGQAKAENQFDRIPITVNFEGDMAAFQSALVTFAGDSKPVILVDGFLLRTPPVLKADMTPRLSGQLDLVVLRAHS